MRYILIACSLFLGACAWMRSHPEVEHTLEKMGEDVGEEVLKDAMEMMQSPPVVS